MGMHVAAAGRAALDSRAAVCVREVVPSHLCGAPEDVECESTLN